MRNSIRKEIRNILSEGYQNTFGPAIQSIHAKENEKPEPFFEEDPEELNFHKSSSKDSVPSKSFKFELESRNKIYRDLAMNEPDLMYKENYSLAKEMIGNREYDITLLDTLIRTLSTNKRKHNTVYANVHDKDIEYIHPELVYFEPLDNGNHPYYAHIHYEMSVGSRGHKIIDAYYYDDKVVIGVNDYYARASLNEQNLNESEMSYQKYMNIKKIYFDWLVEYNEMDYEDDDFMKFIWDHLNVWEVSEGDYGYDSEFTIKINGKNYYGEW